MLRPRLLPVVVVAAVGLTACGGDDTSTPEPTATSATPDAVTTTDPAVEPTTDATATDAPSPRPTASSADPTTAEVPTPDTTDPVVLAFDGRAVPLATACAGVDGSILATTEGEVTITLVREEGTALRYQAEGTTAETDEVTVDESADDTVFTATLSSEQVEPLAVTMTVATDALSTLPSC